MINKKILAAAIASTFALSAHAAVDLATANTALKYASQTIANGGTIVANAATNVTVPIGQNLPIVAADAKFFLRFELANAKFQGNALEATDLSTPAATTNITLESGGAVGESYATFGYINSATALSTAVLTLDFMNSNDTGFTVTDTTLPVTVTYKLYENVNGLAALNGGAGEVAAATKSLPVYTFVTGQNIAGSFVPSNQTALVSSQFKKYTGDLTEAPLGKIQLAVAAGVIAANDSTQVVAADVYTTPGALTAALAGDFSFGTFNLSTSATCVGPGTAVVVPAAPAAQTTATIVATNYTIAHYLCSDVSGLTALQVIPKIATGAVVTLSGNTGLAGSVGTISYDTTSIAVPYVTTYENYNQRIYLTNTSVTDAAYTTTFRSEEGTTAVAGTAATGIVKAGTMLAIKAVDLVTITGATTRASATIEIEAQDSNIIATSQTVRKTTGETDTVSLFGELNVLTSSLATAQATATANATALTTANAAITAGNAAVAVTTAATQDAAVLAAAKAAALLTVTGLANGVITNGGAGDFTAPEYTQLNAICAIGSLTTFSVGTVTGAALIGTVAASTCI